MYIIGKGVFCFETEEFSSEELVENLDSTNIETITFGLSNGENFTMAATEVRIKELVQMLDNDEEVFLIKK